MTRSEYERLKAAAKARYEKDIEAIERVWSLSSDDKASKPIPLLIMPRPLTPQPVESEKAQETARTTDFRSLVPPVSRSNRERGSVDKAVREVVDKHINGAVFSSTLVSTKVKEHFDPDINRTSISGALKRLARTGVLKVVQEGVGRRPASYRKVS